MSFNVQYFHCATLYIGKQKNIVTMVNAKLKNKARLTFYRFVAE